MRMTEGVHYARFVWTQRKWEILLLDAAPPHGKQGHHANADDMFECGGGGGDPLQACVVALVRRDQQPFSCVTLLGEEHGTFLSLAMHLLPQTVREIEMLPQDYVEVLDGLR